MLAMDDTAQLWSAEVEIETIEKFRWEADSRHWSIWNFGTKKSGNLRTAHLGLCHDLKELGSHNSSCGSSSRPPHPKVEQR